MPDMDVDPISTSPLLSFVKQKQFTGPTRKNVRDSALTTMYKVFQIGQ